MKHTMRLAAPVLALTLLAGCATTSPNVAQSPGYNQGRTQAAYVEYGRVTRIEQVQSGKHDGSIGAGAVVGGAAGAVVGRQMADSSRGKNVGTVLGAVAGALIGHQIEKDQAKGSAVYRITVALDKGGVRSFDYQDPGTVRVGDRVKVENDHIVKL